MLNILYDPYIVEEVVFFKLREIEGTGNTELYGQYHNRSDRIYELDDEDERSDGFVELNKEFFNTLGFSEAVRVVVDEFPELHEKIEEIHIRKPTTIIEVGSDLVDKRKKAVIRLFSEQFMDITHLKKFFRHELMHVVDMLDEKFGYKEGKLAKLPVEETIVRENINYSGIYLLIAALKSGERRAVQSKDERFGEFEKLYARLPADGRKAVLKVFGRRKI